MKKPMALFSSLLSLFLLLLLFFFFATKLLAAPLSNNPPTSRCPSFDCGNGLRLSYPFWKNDKGTNSPYTCGYREFGIRCDPNGEPVLTLPSDDYYVRHISYSDATVTLVDIDVSTEQCPRARRNLTLPILPVLDYSTLDLNLTFYFNCSSSPSDSLLPIECLLFGAFRSYVTDQRDGDVEELNWVGLCQDKVVATVRSEEINVNGLIGGYKAALKSGFVLDWRAVRQCGACEASNGYCGYNTTAPASFLCFCDDGSARPDHCPGSNSKLPLKIGIGIGCGLGGIIIGCLAFYLRRRYKGLSVRPALLSRNISSDPSSVNDSEKGGSFPGVHLFTYSELEQATNHFDSARELGDGGFGTVYYGKLRDGRAVAVKRLFEHNFKRVEQFMNEVEILAHLHHKNLVQLYGCTSRHSRELLLVYEFIQNGTVADHLHGQHAKPGGLPWPVRLKIAIETASALAYLHASDIIHRDVKTHNILLDDSFIVKVADFGLSRLFPTDVTHVSTTPQGTPGYVDPEYHQCYQLTDKSDVFSFGVVLVELISSKPAVDITRHRHEINLSNMAINKIQNRALHELVDPYLGFESDYKVRKMITAVAELAFQCLQYEKDVRPSMMEVLEALKGIENDDFNKQKAEEMDVSVEEVVLLKSGPLPLSPDSVTVKWNSSSESAASNISS